MQKADFFRIHCCFATKLISGNMFYQSGNLNNCPNLRNITHNYFQSHCRVDCYGLSLILTHKSEQV